jgi:hypothetical protein
MNFSWLTIICAEGQAEDSPHGDRVLEQLEVFNGMATVLFTEQEQSSLTLIIISVILGVSGVVFIVTLVVLYRLWKQKKEYSWLEQTFNSQTVN